MILTQSHDRFIEIILNYPEKHHAITLEMAKQLDEIIEQIDQNTNGFLLIRGEGEKAFCAGGDLRSFHSDMTADEAFEKLIVVNRVLQKIAFFRLPTIALLNGHAFGGGCELASACDFRIAFPERKFGFIQTNLGILPGWGGDALLYERLDPVKAYHWMTSGEKYTTEHLHQLGWIQSLVDPEATYDVILKSYLNKSPEQMRLLKQQYLKRLPAQLVEEMEAGTKRCASLWGSQAHQAALKAFFQK